MRTVPPCAVMPRRSATKQPMHRLAMNDSCDRSSTTSRGRIAQRRVTDVSSARALAALPSPTTLTTTAPSASAISTFSVLMV
jgi:hypothetical protein